MIKRILAVSVATLACGAASAQEARPISESLARKYADLEASAPHLSAFRGGANLVPYFISVALILAILYVIIHLTRAGK